MQMPGMNGEALALAIRADARLAGTQLVMLTPLGGQRDVRRLEELGFAGYLTKPTRPQELKSVLSLALAERGAPHRQPIATRHAARDLLSRFAGSKARILLADDNITNQHVALGILEKLGLRADAVANGAEVVTALETLPYDLVLMDVQMPVMDGLEATRRIRDPQSTVRNHAVPIIAMTAHAMQGDQEACLQAGMNDYVSKPVTPQALAASLEKWLGTGRWFAYSTRNARSSGSWATKTSCERLWMPSWQTSPARSRPCRRVSPLAMWWASRARPTRSKAHPPTSAATPCVRWLPRWRSRHERETWRRSVLSRPGWMHSLSG